MVLFRLLVIVTHALQGRLHDGPVLTMMGLLAVLVVLVTTSYASLALVVRRWHDRGKSGYWALLALIPIIGWVWQGIECGFLEGTLGPNRFGPSPKGISGVIYDS